MATKPPKWLKKLGAWIRRNIGIFFAGLGLTIAIVIFIIVIL